MDSDAVEARVDRSRTLVADSRVALAKARTLLAISKLVRAQADAHRQASRELMQAARVAVTAPR